MSNLNQFLGLKPEDSAAVSGDLGMPALAMRQLADTTTTDTDGDYTILKIDEEGRLKVSNKPASFDIVSGNITASAQTVFCNVGRASNVMIMMNTSSLAGHNVTFEGSLDSTNGTDGVWFGVQAIRSNANTIETTSGVLAATPAYAWELSVNGLAFVRVRATAHTSGTATWKFQRGSYATEPIPAAQISGTQPVSGTVTLGAGTALAANMQLGGRTTSTCTNARIKSAATTNATSAKASAGSVYQISLYNAAASQVSFKLYNKASAPTVGTDVPIATFPIAANSFRDITIPLGLPCAAGIAYAITANRGDTDTTAVVADDVHGFMLYV
jgi:hypothetical protein